MRFRDFELNFKLSENLDRESGDLNDNDYPELEKTLGDFHLLVKAGSFRNSEIIVMLGENGTGKTTFIKMLAGLLPSDNKNEVPERTISYKPQKNQSEIPGDCATTPAP